MNKIFLSIIMLIIITGCNGQSNSKFKKDILNLEKLNNNFNVDFFFDTDEVIYEKYNIGEYEYNTKGNIEGVSEYTHKKSSSTDKLAVFDNLYFSKVGALTNSKNELLVFYAKNENTDSITYHKMISKLKILYGNPIIKDSSNSTDREKLFAKGTRLTWFDKNRVIQIYPKKTYDQFYKKDRFWVTIFIANKLYDKKLRGNLNRGNWSNFD
ncbi:MULTISPECIES: hypothetical protein [Flavobacteriaceae]|uniref:hypothetical protein n=1 Tax=Flavobacteriaceae TaxID=49546 RepID=UPI001C1F4C9E|nr:MULTISPECIES: hypothetical protein [Flavobacteriaceae]MDO7138892.1 hypothetical protein [Algibacter lectus]QWX85411.1 hypothetical protein H0I23_07155 [Cellulophaga sp. HaHaR_3_176]